MFEELEKLFCEARAALGSLAGIQNELAEIRKSVALLASKSELAQTKEQIMSQITDWAATEQADLDAISTTLDGIVAGIAALDTLITNLQNSQGTLSSSDQTALDAIQSASAALKVKSAAIAVTPPGATAAKA